MIGLILLTPVAVVIVLFSWVISVLITRWLPSNRWRTLLRAVIVVAVFQLIVFICWPRLISDQQMIKHFNAHKQEFNALVQTYLQYGENPMAWSKRPDVVELEAQTGVERIFDGEHYWFDNPYSLESAKKLKQMDDEKSWNKNHSHRSAVIIMSDHKNYNVLNLITGDNWKNYYYFPVDFITEHGRMKSPRELHSSGLYDLWWRVVDSTDSIYWWNSKRGECVLRKIEPKWYIFKCRAG